MKKLFLVLAAAAMTFSTAIAQEAATATAEQPATEVVEAVEAPAEAVLDAETEIAGDSIHYVLMQKFLEGGWGWMLPILVVLVLGMAIAIERILYLSLSTINTKKFIAQVEAALNEGGVEAAKEVCRNTKGPIASIFYRAWIVTTWVSMQVRRQLYLMVRFRQVRWSRVLVGCRCSSRSRHHSDLWVPLLVLSSRSMLSRLQVISARHS